MRRDEIRRANQEEACETTLQEAVLRPVALAALASKEVGDIQVDVHPAA